MRIATWNVNSLKARMPRVEEWLGYAQPDVVCLQETKMADEAFPHMAFDALGYESAHHGEGRWNGVAILSKVGIENPINVPSDNDGTPEARILTATCGGVRVTCVYVPNGRDLDDPHYAYKRRWMAALRKHIDTDSQPGDPVVVAGDFNIAPGANDVHPRIKAPTHTSDDIRADLTELMAFGLDDTFRLLYPVEPIYSWWDYRAGDFHQGRGLRIDLVLGSTSICEAMTFSLIDRQMRKGTSPSDHAPVFIDVEPNW